MKAFSRHISADGPEHHTHQDEHAHGHDDACGHGHADTSACTCRACAGGCACGHEHADTARAPLLFISAALFPLSLLAARYRIFPAATFLFAAGYALGAFPVWRAALSSLRSGAVLDENFLVGIATLGAVALKSYAEAAAVLLLFQLGEFLSDRAAGRSRRSILALLAARPDKVTLLRGGAEVSADPAEAGAGETMLVRPGERAALDGIVRGGTSTLDTSPLTGESVPRAIAPGGELLSGCINLSGLLTAEITRPLSQSTATRILALVEEAAGKKARAERFITRFAARYTPAVVVLAVLLALLPPLFTDLTFSQSLYRALVFLVISCPCALVISIPLTFFSGLGTASRYGILIKGSRDLEALARVKTGVFDKTGTLTEGVFEVTAIHPAQGVSEASLLHLAAAAEAQSNHPIAQALRRVSPGEIPSVSDVAEEAGLGVSVTLDGVRVAAGSARLMEKLGFSAPAPAETGTVVHVARGGAYMGHLVISDRTRADAEGTIRTLRAQGVGHIALFTGDRREAGEALARDLGLDGAHCELLPADKVARVEALLDAQREGEALFFVGDGMNDAPVLSRADVGVAMGGLGADAAIEAADVVILSDAPSRLPVAIDIARRTMRIARENIALTLGLKILVLLLGAFGFASMWLAVFADAGVALLAVGNAMRVMRFKPPADKRAKTGNPEKEFLKEA
ncbi:MAG TPA: heavy metal translocating P-type ATPase [Oscillospiraceae bacterium]|nr:heavy metal translocating P-type ATPase [Oscillospiraceae bacterium]